MKTIETKINIKASAEQVWKVLMDFNAYPEWTRFFAAQGEWIGWLITFLPAAVAVHRVAYHPPTCCSCCGSGGPSS